MKRYVAKARYPVLVVLAATVVLLFLELRTPEPARARPIAFRQPVPQGAPPNLLAVLSRVGINAHAVAAAGLNDVDAVGLLARVAAAESALEALAAQIDLADAAVQLASGLAPAVRERPSDGALAAEYQAAQNAVGAANQQIGQICESLFAIALEGLGAEQVQRLDAHRSGAGYAVPPEFKVVTRSPQEWKAVVRALRAEARALRMNEDLNEGQAQLLTQIRGDPAVVIAAANLQLNLDAVEAVFDGVN